MSENNLKTEIVKAIKHALKQFGEYQYHDKGPTEVMDVHSFVEKLNTLPPNECVDVLGSVWNNKSNRIECRMFVGSCMIDMQDVVDERWEILCEDERLQKAYDAEYED